MSEKMRLDLLKLCQFGINFVDCQGDIVDILEFAWRIGHDDGRELISWMEAHREMFRCPDEVLVKAMRVLIGLEVGV